jgi:hypothetical protein
MAISPQPVAVFPGPAASVLLISFDKDCCPFIAK